LRHTHPFAAMTTQYRTSADMYPVIESYLDSGLTQQVFCREHRLSMPVFRYWLAKYRRERRSEQTRTGSGAFIEMSAPAGESAVAELVYPNGVRLRLFAAVEADTLGRLVSAGAR
jgi:hypothetical protein